MEKIGWWHFLSLWLMYVNFFSLQCNGWKLCVSTQAWYHCFWNKTPLTCKLQRGEKSNFLYFVSELKIYYLPFSFYSNETFHILAVWRTCLTDETCNGPVHYRVVSQLTSWASERGIWRSEVRSLMGSLNFSLSNTREKRTLIESQFLVVSFSNGDSLLLSRI